MLWIYDEAIAADLSDCLNPDGGVNTTIKVLGDEGVIGILAQMQEDRIQFPAIFLERFSETPLDSKRYNYTRLHKGVPAVLDNETNNVYLEKVAPIELKYNMHVMTTNTVDMDELLKELLFRYSSMYYVNAQVPYESKRKIRFGVAINPDTPISKKSGTFDYISSGKLYESIIELDCQGAVLLSYTPRHIQRAILEKIVAKP